MKRRIIYFSGLLALAVAMAACSEDPKMPVIPIKPVEPEKPLPALTTPSNTAVILRNARSAVVEWRGDETATGYEVEMAGEKAIVKGTTFGKYLYDDTDYTWRVRAIRGSDTTAWVAGPAFRTLTYDDPRGPWIGDWTVGDDYVLKADISGTDVPLDEITNILPADMIQTILAVATMRLSAAPEHEEPTDYAALLFSLGLLDEAGVTDQLLDLLGLSGVNSFFLQENGTLSMYEDPGTQIDYPGLPLPISELPFADAIPALSGTEGLIINTLRVTINGVQLDAGPVAGDSMLLRIVVSGAITITTNQGMVDLVIGLANPKLKITFDSTVTRAQ